MKQIIFHLFFILIASCAVGEKSVSSLGQLGQDDVLLVGRFELTPELGKNEQDLQGVDGESYRNKFYLFFSDTPKNITQVGMGDFSSMAAVEGGKDFYIRFPRQKKFIYSGAIVLMYYNSRGARNVHYPASFEFSVDPKDKAIYLGTIRYHRDDYNDIKKFEVINNHSSALSKFQKKFRTKMNLKNSTIMKLAKGK